VLADTLFRLGIGVVGLIAGGYALARLLRAKGRSAMAFIGPAFLIIWSTFWLAAHMSMAEIVLRTREWHPGARLPRRALGDRAISSWIVASANGSS
jgi:hypothetical protein